MTNNFCMEISEHQSTAFFANTDVLHEFNFVLPFSDLSKNPRTHNIKKVVNAVICICWKTFKL